MFCRIAFGDIFILELHVQCYLSYLLVCFQLGVWIPKRRHRILINILHSNIFCFCLDFAFQTQILNNNIWLKYYVNGIELNIRLVVGALVEVFWLSKLPNRRIKMATLCRRLNMTDQNRCLYWYFFLFSYTFILRG